jgi:hypothetical protein
MTRNNWNATVAAQPASLMNGHYQKFPDMSNGTSNGHTEYDQKAADGLVSECKIGNVDYSNGVHDVVLNTFRLLIADLCQQFKGGHPG